MGEHAMSSAAPQHLQALQIANRVRLARAGLKRRVAGGETSAAEVILECPWESASMEISDLLMTEIIKIVEANHLTIGLWQGIDQCF